MENKTYYSMSWSPKDLANSTITQWSIPIYQRLFVWEEEQIQQLLDDLYGASRNPNSPYYIGYFTIYIGNETKENSKWTVVDGQQRLTFLSLFAAWCISRNVFKKQWSSFLYNQKKDFRIYYSAREEEKADLRKIVDGLKNGIDDLTTVNFRTFCRCIEKMRNEILNKSENYPISFEDYSKYVFCHASFLVSQLPIDYEIVDLNRFFERMNAAGRQLTPIDQIIGQYFPAKADLCRSCLNFERCFKTEPGKEEAVQNESSIVDIINSDTKDKTSNLTSQEEDEANATSILSPEIMLLHVLYLTLENQISEKQNNVNRDAHHILDTFKKVITNLKVENGENSERNKFINAFINNLQAYRTWLDEHVIYRVNPDDSNISYELRNKLRNDNKDDKDRLKLIQFQSMLYVSTSSEWQGWVLDYYKNFNDYSQLNAKDELNYLKREQLYLESEQDYLKRVQPYLESEQKPKRKIRTFPSKTAMLYPAIDRYWFWLLDYQLWELNFDDALENQLVIIDSDPHYKLKEEYKKAIIYYRFRKNRSIEHLHPQHPQEETNVHWKKDREINNDLVRNGFGNLAMISTSFNSAQGNDSIGVKFANVRDNQLGGIGKLQSIKMLLMFLEADTSEDKWVPELAEKHKEKMLKLLEVFFQEQQKLANSL